jgi:translation initiation factor IF-2
VRAIHDDRGHFCDKALPSFPVEISGLNGTPNPGEQLLVVPDEKSAREIAEGRREEESKKKLLPRAHFKLEDLYQKVKEEHLKQLKVILKADVGGTLEAVEGAIKKIPSQEVELIIVHKGVGAVNASDVLLAEVTDSIIVGFKVTIDAHVRELAKQKGIELRSYQIVYELIDDVKAALEGLLTPQIKRTFLGRARTKTVFKLSRSGTVAGCMVEKGKIMRGAHAQVFRGNEVIFEGKIQTLKRFKDDVKEVTEGLECGIGLGYDGIAEGDIIDAFKEEIVTRRLKMNE